MPIKIDLFKKEGNNLLNALEEGINFGKLGQYDKAIEKLTEAIISAGLLMKKDPKIGKLLRLDDTILVAEGYQLKAYSHKLKSEPRKKQRILEEMVRIARGNLDFDNPYLVKIKEALDELTETNMQGDFYTRKSEY